MNTCKKRFRIILKGEKLMKGLQILCISGSSYRALEFSKTYRNKTAKKKWAFRSRIPNKQQKITVEMICLLGGLKRRITGKFSASSHWYCCASRVPKG